ncbi:TMEM175 family protein [Kribbella monticola]|uniref:TMEM175 family protein n=1 Tax=Kribbella monticola TaxID=2185285 RepID=UPI001E6598E5|nr:TMEM175 family protein [Kribbella monticola]
MTRDPDRLVLFTDAVVAIAVTLLILPLVEAVTEAAQADETAWAMVHDQKDAIYSFLLSFVVIARFWLTHHRVFEHVKAYNRLLVQLNLLWLLCIVILPFPTEIMGHFQSSRFTAGFYVGTLAVLSLCQTGLTLLIHGHRELEVDENPVTGREVVGSITFSVFSLIAFLLAALVPGVNFYSLFALFVAAPAARLAYRLRERRVSAA